MDISALMQEPAVAKALAWADAHAAEIAEEAIRICEIPAPTFEEGERAKYVRGRFEALGLRDVTIDGAGNVRGRRPGKGGGPGLAMAAHLDTVFPKGTDVTVKRQGTRLAAPGIGDNSVAIAGLLGMIEALNAADLQTQGDLYLASNTGEEGLGDLRGMKAFMADVKDRVGAAIAVEGMKVNRLIHVAVGSRRYKVTYTARGGHSWGHFGSPSAIHILGRAIAEISRLDVPREPKTTYNVGVIHGGTTVNTIAAEADMLVDMRSVDTHALTALEKRVLAIVERAAKEGAGHAKLEMVGDRPAGSIPADHPVVRTCRAVHEALGLRTFSEPASTDHNVPLGMGLPGVCLSITEGANEHRLDEYIETGQIPTGVKNILLAALGLTSAAV
ncbi:MAG TPA: M20/M25/M40 family metallo-hydrolase [Candidatus Methylomirabilis sp.]|nr:M20/M25/M40 family metallo-hydrolase [Candidatus Methylomirabilis sp.]